MAEPVGGDLLGADPGQVAADADPQAVVAPVGDRPAVPVAHQPAVRWGVALLGVADECGHQGRGYRLPPDRLALFPEQDQALVAVQVGRAQGEGAAAAAGGLGVQPQDHRVELGIVSGGGGDLVDLGQPGVVHGPAGGW